MRCSPPNFKRVRLYKSFTLKQKAGCKSDENTHTLKVNGQHYRYCQSRRISGKVKAVTIKLDSLGDFYVCIVTNEKNYSRNANSEKRRFRLWGEKIFNGVGRIRHNQFAVFGTKFNRDKKSLQNFFTQKRRFKQSTESSFKTCKIVQKNIQSMTRFSF